ncbi:hypothetical protein I6U48_17735 [Clostridium sp. PL3]|uniref:Uncharacterized protein n=1 Tax=Clostridium thailandense TaxID=2794346 RepID=A0A949U1S7_9CLOT|nr:hypothetical protein [Clostridium thailandense]MBV7274739.1 hypothetical protein [Clostridium thailandense]
MINKNHIKIFSNDGELIDTLDLYKKDAERLMRQLRTKDKAEIEDVYSEDGKSITKVVHETEDCKVVDEIIFDDDINQVDKGELKPEQIESNTVTTKTNTEIVYMDSKANEFLKQLNSEIEKTKKDLEKAKKNLAQSIETTFNIPKYGLAGQAENVMKLSTQLETLKLQKQRFEYIFKDAE